MAVLKDYFHDQLISYFLVYKKSVHQFSGFKTTSSRLIHCFLGETQKIQKSYIYLYLKQIQAARLHILTNFCYLKVIWMISWLPKYLQIILL